MQMGSNIFSMPMASTALLLSFAFGLTSAMPWTGPQETKVYRAVDFSPKPTSSPVDSARLTKRDQWVPVNVCGWIAGKPESVARCGSGSSCVHDTIHNVVGCCATAGPCTDGVYTTCVDSGKNGWKSTLGLVNNGILSCKPSATCFQNTFAGNYKQFSCGEVSAGGEIQTTYEGQASDMRLQQVYMGVTYSPMSRALYTIVSSDTPSTGIPEAGKANPTSTQAPGSSSSDKEETTGYIAGGTIGGVAVAAIAIAGIVLFLRRRKLRKGQRVGGFVSLDHEEKPPSSGAGPFKRMTRYSAHDFGPISRRSTAQEVAYMSPTEDGTTYISPLTGHPNQSHAPYNIPHERDQLKLAAQSDTDLLAPSPQSASTYNGAFPTTYETTIPTSRLNIRSASQSPSPQPIGEEQRQPLVAISVDELGPTWNSTTTGSGYGGLGHQQAYSGDMPEGTDMGLVGNMRRAASQIISGNSRTVDHNVRSESFRHSRADSESHVDEFGHSIWDSQPMNPPTLHLNTLENNGSLGFDLNAGGGSTTGSVGSSNARTLVPGDVEAEGKEVYTGEKPLMEQMMEAFNKATRVGGEPTVVVKKDVYQLVDEGISANGTETGGPSAGSGMN